MEEKIKRFILILITLLSFGCGAVQYSPPTIQPVSVTSSVTATKSELFLASKKVLILEGFQIANMDQELGLISTNEKQMKLTTTDVDCGRTMGIPYIKDKRTITRVSVIIECNDNSINVKCNITGEYGKGWGEGSSLSGIDLTCVSKGTIDNILKDKIISSL